MKEIINKHWHILNINMTFGDVFKATPNNFISRRTIQTDN